MFDKEVYNLKINVNNICNLNCSYCFLEKWMKEISIDIVEKSLDFFINSKWNKKIIRIYWWEPLLSFDLLKKTIIIAHNKIKESKKDIMLTICSNWILLDIDKIEFFKKYGVYFALSYLWNRNIHNKFRKYKNWKWTYDIVRNKMVLILKYYSNDKVALAFDVHTENVGSFYKDYKEIINLWFDTINIAPIVWIKWTKSSIYEMYKNMVKVFMRVYHSIWSHNPLYLCTINRELRYWELSKNFSWNCIFFKYFELGVNGDIIFTPFWKSNKNAWNILTWINKELILCNNHNMSKCLQCSRDYSYWNNDNSVNEIINRRNLLSIKFAKLIKEKAENNIIFENYIQKAINKMPF